MVITGVEARAAFLRMKPTPRAFRNSSYFSEETCVYVPVMGAIFIRQLLDDVSIHVPRRVRLHEDRVRLARGLDV